MKSKVALNIDAVLNTYAILFFSQNKVFGAILLLSSFLNPVAGVSGLCCALFSLMLANTFGYRHQTIQTGVYSFNTLLLGIAFGSFYQVDACFIGWLLILGAIITVLSIVLNEILGKRGLPLLSLPFIIGFWLLLCSMVYCPDLQLKSNYLAQQLFSGTTRITNIHTYLFKNLPEYLALFFRALSSILFQDNILTGILISTGLLIHSRIAFSLSVIGFIATVWINSLLHVYPSGITYYYLGANFMMSAIAIGSFVTIPSFRSYLWAVLAIPFVFVLVNAFSILLAAFNLPVLSLPFCVITITLLYVLSLRKNPRKLQLVTLQHYSPERNLYQYINHKTRLDNLKYFPLHLPFMGSRTVSQGYDGTLTHKAEWGKALDFVIEDEEKKTFKYPGTLPEHFYCFNKPVLACADGIIANVVDHVEDNDIGESNLNDNWGNTVVIKHLAGLYSKVSHLKKGSVKVSPGDFVKQGDLLGLCGNSGRSPEPHLHFQVQATSYIDAKTLEYPLAWYISQGKNASSLNSFAIPVKGEIVTPPSVNRSVKKAFNFQPGYVAVLSGKDKEESIEVFIDELSQTYLYSMETGAAAYFVNDGTAFRFTSFYGDEESLLYYFYLSAFNISFSDDQQIATNDIYPLQLTINKPLLWLQDFIAPFYTFIRLDYVSTFEVQKTNTIIKAKQIKTTFGKQRQEMDAGISISNNSLMEFRIKLNGHHKKVQWLKKSTY